MKRLAYLISGLFFLLAACLHASSSNTTVALDATASIVSNWNGGYVTQITLTNSSTIPISSWTVNFALQPGQTIGCLWNGSYTQSDQNIAVTNQTGSSSLAPGQSITLGFKATDPEMLGAVIGNLAALGNTSEVPASDFLLSATYAVDVVWATAFQTVVTLTNPTPTQATSWTASFTLPEDYVLSTYVMNGVFSVNGQTVTVSSPSTNAAIPPHSSTTFTMIINMPRSAAPVINNLQAVANGTAQQPLQMPVLQPISNPNGSGTYSVTWGAVSGAQTYLLQQSNTPTFTTSTTLFNGAGTSFQVQNQMPGTYYYQVTAVAGNLTGGPSLIQSTVVVPANSHPETPVLQPISNPSGSGTYSVTWGAVSGAQTYVLQQSNTPTFTTSTTVFNGTGTSFQVQNQTPGTYYYQVTAVAGNLTSGPSLTQNTTVLPPSTLGMEHSAWYIDWTSWFNGPPFVLPTTQTGFLDKHSNTLNIFVGKLMFDANGNPTLGGFGNLTSPNPSQISAFAAYCHEQTPPVSVKVSIGGSGGMYDNCWDLLTSENIQAFAQGIVNYCLVNGLDGIDFDYEQYASTAQETLVGALIRNVKLLNPNLKTSLCTNAGFGPNYPWQAIVQTILNAAMIGPGNCAVDRLYIMSYYDPIQMEQAWITGWANWLIQNYNFTPARISAGIDDFDAHAYDPVAFFNWAVSQGFSTAHWAFDPANP